MTLVNESSDRHIGLAVIERYFAQALDGVLSIPGKPPTRMVVAPSRAQLAVRVPAEDAAPDVASFTNLSLDLVDDEGVTWHQLSVRIEGNLGEVYDMLCSIVDRIQISGASFPAAVDEALESLAEILAKRRRLSDEQELGLAGELLTFMALTHEHGVALALSSWVGPQGEEHDFALPSGDLEVKVTLGERRQHWISSVTQLVPTPARDLYLVSIQLTAAGAAEGWSLPDLVAQVRALSTQEPNPVDTVLARTNYRALDADLYSSRWALRSDPQFFLVDDEFPAISQSLLSKSVPSSQRIMDVRYRIDLTGLPASPGLLSFRDIGTAHP
jgi:hypothetical protein